MKQQITKDQRALNILRRAVEFGFKLDHASPLYANVVAAEETLIDEKSCDRIEDIGYDTGSYNYVDWNDGKGYNFTMEGEFISSDRNENEYFERLGDGTLFRSTPLADHDPGDIVYVKMIDVVDSDAQVVTLVAKYKV